jgi:hypothetical protein
MPAKNKKKSAEADNTTLSSIKNIQDQYTDSNLKEIVSSHLLAANVTLKRQEWLWVDTLHTSKLFTELGKKNLFKYLLIKNETGQTIKVVEFGCGGRGPSLIMNLARWFPSKVRYLGIDNDGRVLADSKKEFNGSNSIFFANFNSGGPLKVIRSGMRNAFGWPELAELLIEKNISSPDLIVFRHTLIINAGEITSPYAYFAHLMTERTPQLFNGATILVTTYLDWEQDAALRYLLVSFPHPDKIMMGKLQYPCHYHKTIIFGLIPWDVNLDQFYLGIPHYEYHGTALTDILFYNLLPALPYIVVSQIALRKIQKYYPQLIYFPVNLASAIFFLGYSINQDLSFGTAATESIMINNFFSLVLCLGISYDLHRIFGQKAEPVLSVLVGMVSTYIINRFLAAYIPSNLGFTSHNVIYAEQNQTILPAETGFNFTALPVSPEQSLQCSSASRTLSTPFWLIGLLWMPLVKLSAALRGKLSPTKAFESLLAHQNTFDRLEEKRINPVLKKFQRYGYGHEPVALELSDMQRRIKQLLDEGVNSQTVSKFLLDDIDRFMGYLNTRLAKAESYLESYRFFDLPKSGPGLFPVYNPSDNKDNTNFTHYGKPACPATQQHSGLSLSRS